MKHFKDTKEYKPANAVTAASLGSMCSLITRKTCEYHLRFAESGTRK